MRHRKHKRRKHRHGLRDARGRFLKGHKKVRRSRRRRHRR